MHKYHIKEETRYQKELNRGSIKQFVVFGGVCLVMVAIIIVFNYSERIYNKLKRGLENE